MDEAEIIYRDFCEGPSSGRLTQAWHEYEQIHGAIESNSLVEKLIVAAMQYAIDHRID
jgi:hypothetical protein